MKRGIFVVAELGGEVRERIMAIQRWADPKLARHTTPHVTLVGSSGLGPIAPDTAAAELRARLEPIAAETQPLTLQFGRPMRFMQTDIVVLPLDPHGALRALHERIATSGLRFERPRFAFSPHCTLSFYPTLVPDLERRLLAVRVEEPVVIDRLRCYLTVEPVPGKLITELRLG